jgi:hypothetical protein
MVRPAPNVARTRAFNLDSKERFLFDLWAQEHTGIAGTELDYWSLDTKASKRDPLYDESIVRVWKGPFRFPAYFEWADSTPEAREEGMRTTWSASCWIARKNFEDFGAPPISEGDIIRVWNVPFFDDFSVDGENLAVSGYYFDVINVNDDGHLWDQFNFVGYSCSIERRTEYTPERRLLNQ